MKIEVDVRVALAQLRGEQAPRPDVGPPLIAAQLAELYSDRFLVAVKLADVPAAGPEAELTYRYDGPADRAPEHEDETRALVERRGLTVLASRVRFGLDGPATTRGREYALGKLAERRDHPPARVDDSTLPAGSPMHYYCKSCGHLADVKPESWWVRPPQPLCPECQALDQLGWLE